MPHAAAQEAREPRVDALTLQLTNRGTAQVGLVISDAERRRIGDPNTLQLRFEKSEVGFRASGERINQDGQDGKPVRGLPFVAEMPIDLGMLEAFSRELQATERRARPQFAPGGREVIGRQVLPERPLDLERLRKGERILVPSLTGFGLFPSLGAVKAGQIDVGKSLTITLLPVIEDPQRTFQPCGNAASNSPLKAWTFGHLMEQMSQGSGLTPSQFVERWLAHWTTPQTIGAPVLDGVSAAAAPGIQNDFIDPWRARSGGGPLDLSIAPFRLQAILYRPDLGSASPYSGGTGNNAGELRFVFGFVNVRDANKDGDALDRGDTCVNLEAAVIFEYGIPGSSCTAIKSWANELASLSSELPGSPGYNGKLAMVTEKVVQSGADPLKPNKNALNQLRTNEIAFTRQWQFREFHLVGTGLLAQTTTRNNPREHQAVATSIPGVTPLPINLNGSADVAAEITANAPSLLAHTYVVPEQHAGQPFLGGQVSYNLGTFWDAPGVPDDARHELSMLTCSGCHTAETDTVFYHIRPVGSGASPTLSPFLSHSGHTATVKGVVHPFDEPLHRAEMLAQLANLTCKPTFPPFSVFFKKLQSTH